MDDVLPDVLAPDLTVLFCGNAAGTVSARIGAPYAGPGNGFWRTLHEVGLTPSLLAPSEFRRLPEFGLGLTDACKVRFGSDAEVGTADHDASRLEETVRRVDPLHFAFVGKRAAETVIGRPVDYGPQPEPFAGAETWVLPSTSGRARRFWDIEPWRRLAAGLKRPARGDRDLPTSARTGISTRSGAFRRADR